MSVVSPRARTIPPGTTDAFLSRLFADPNPWLDDPSGWVHEKLNEFLWSKQEEVCTSVLNHRYTAVRSAHDTGKSFIASRIASWWIDAHNPGEAFVVSTAPSQTQVEAILWREIGRAHRLGDLVGRITYGTVPAWKIGQEIVGFGRKPQDLASKEEAMAAFQGIHAKYVLIVIDEAGGVPRWLFDAVDTLATNEAARVLAIGNPDDPASHFAQICAPGSGWHGLHISAFDTPAFTGEEVPADLLDVLVSPNWVEERKQRWGESSPLYVSKVLGEFPEITDDTLLSPRTIRECQARELPGRRLGQYGYDIARFGTDETVGYRNREGVIRLCFSGHKMDTMETAGHIYAEVERHKKKAPAHVDVIGIGAGVVDRLNEQRINVVPFNASNKAFEDKKFINRRAEVYWNFKEDCEAGEIDLPPEGEDDELISQLGSIKWFIDSRGRIGIESKDSMKKRGLPSPDRADACVMSNIHAPHIKLPSQVEGKGSAGGTLTGDLLRREL